LAGRCIQKTENFNGGAMEEGTGADERGIGSWRKKKIKRDKLR